MLLDENPTHGNVSPAPERVGQTRGRVGWWEYILSTEGPELDEVVVFDVNETLLDVSALLPEFERVLPGNLLGLWFSTMLRNSMVATLTSTYAPFDQQGIAALRSVGHKAGVDISEHQASVVVEGMASLPAHPDVVPALERISGSGYRMATLTNSSATFLRRQMANSQLGGFFEKLLSVEAVQMFKPAPEAYRYAASQMGTPLGKMRLVAAHDWDVTGAIRAGATAAFVARGGARLSRLSEKPEIVADDLAGVAEALEQMART